MRAPRILILPEDHAIPTVRWSVASHLPRRSCTVFARFRREAELLGSQLLHVAPDRLIAVESPPFLESRRVA